MSTRITAADARKAAGYLRELLPNMESGGKTDLEALIAKMDANSFNRGMEVSDISQPELGLGTVFSENGNGTFMVDFGEVCEDVHASLLAVA